MGHFENNHVIHGRSFHPARNRRAGCLFFATDTLVSYRREISWISISLNRRRSRDRDCHISGGKRYIESILERMHRRDAHWQCFVVTLNYSKFQCPMDKYCTVVRKKLTPLTMLDLFAMQCSKTSFHVYTVGKKVFCSLLLKNVFHPLSVWFSSPNSLNRNEFVSILFMVIRNVNKMKNLNLYYGRKVLHDKRFICT